MSWRDRAFARAAVWPSGGVRGSPSGPPSDQGCPTARGAPWRPRDHRPTTARRPSPRGARPPPARPGVAYRPSASTEHPRTVAPDPEAHCRSARERRARSRPEGGARLAALLVELAVEMQTLEDELHRGGDRRGVAGRAQLGDRALHPGDLQRLLHVLLAREGGGDVHRRAPLERREKRVELDERERPVEDVQHRTLHEAIDNALLRDLADRLELDLPGGRRDDRGEVADTRDDARLARA